GFSPEARAQAVWFLRILFPLNVFTAQAAVLTAVLNSLSRFVGVVAATVLGQVLAIGVLLVALPSLGVQALAYGSAAAAIGTSLTLAVVAGRLGYQIRSRS